MPVDPFAALYPENIDALPVAWNHIHIPGPPLPYRLNEQESNSSDTAIRFKRRTIQSLNIESTGAEAKSQTDRLSFVDKVSPHSMFDLMCTEISEPLKATVNDIGRETGELMCRSAFHFVEFVSRPDIIDIFSLERGEMHLGLNCDPNTLDRESIQASKQFHMHFLYWKRSELSDLVASKHEPIKPVDLLLRRLLDPLLFLGAAMVCERLREMNFDGSRMTLRPFDSADSIEQGLPMGCLIQLKDWTVLNSGAFVTAIQRIHEMIETEAQRLNAALTGHIDAPRAWQRFDLLPRRSIEANIDKLGYSQGIRDQLKILARNLRNVSPALMEYFKRHKFVRLRHLLLNNPAYALNLYSPRINSIDQPLIESNEIYLCIQLKLFSAIGGSGLTTLRRIPCSRIVRNQGLFSERDWFVRAQFQQQFCAYNYAMLKDSFDIDDCVDFRYSDSTRGWCEA